MEGGPDAPILEENQDEEEYGEEGDMAPDAEQQDSNNQIGVDEGYEVQVEGEEDDEQPESGRHYEEPDGDEEEQEYGDEQYQDPNQPEMDEDEIDDEQDDEARQHY